MAIQINPLPGELKKLSGLIAEYDTYKTLLDSEIELQSTLRAEIKDFALNGDIRADVGLAEISKKKNQLQLIAERLLFGQQRLDRIERLVAEEMVTACPLVVRCLLDITIGEGESAAVEIQHLYANMKTARMHGRNSQSFKTAVAAQRGLSKNIEGYQSMNAARTCLEVAPDAWAKRQEITQRLGKEIPSSNEFYEAN